MRLIPSLYLVAGLLLAVALGSVALALGTGRQAAFDLQRIDLADSNYQAYLGLSSATYQLLLAFRAAAAAGVAAPDGEAALRDRIRSEAAMIRELTAREIQLVGEEEIEELDRLAAIEREIDSLLEQHAQRLRTGGGTGGEAGALPNGADTRFNTLIQEALDDEASEVAAVRLATVRRIQRLEAVAVGFALIAALATGTGLLVLVRGIRRPIGKLLAGVAAFRDGDLGYRIDTAGHNELDAVGGAFNHMARDLAAREQALSNANQQLEKAVTARTGQLERALAELTASEDNRRRMLADVSHELRTPLTIIRGEAEVALRGGTHAPAFYRAALEKTRDAATHTARLVDDLLFVARHESNTARLNLDDVDLGQLMPEVIAECRTLASDGQHIILESHTQRTVVRGDGDRIRQVVIILLENALRYGGSNVTVHLSPAPAGVAVSITDDGPGMTATEMTQAFDRFFRGSNAGARYASGSGLGLPVAQSIVEAHGGEITLRGDPGEGLTATFTLPRHTPLKAVS